MTTTTSRGFKAIGIFLLFAATMACLAGTTLLWPGTFLDRAWKLNPRAYQTLAPMGKAAGIGFLALASALLLAGIGWFRRCPWGWWLAVAIIALQIAGNFFNIIEGDTLRGTIGSLIAAALLFYLLRPQIRAVFVGGPKGNADH